MVSMAKLVWRMQKNLNYFALLDLQTIDSSGSCTSVRLEITSCQSSLVLQGAAWMFNTEKVFLALEMVSSPGLGY